MQTFLTRDLKLPKIPYPTSCRLTSLIDDRPVGIVLHGHSAKELGERRGEFIEKDICFGSINRYWEIMDLIMPMRIEFLIALSDGMFNMFYQKLIKFPGLIITNRKILGSVNFNCAAGNTLFCLLLLLIHNKVKNIYLFGADGYSDNENPYFSDYYKGRLVQVEEHKRDTEHFNNNFPKDTQKTKIYNVNPDSHYTPFEKITYDQCLYQLSSRHS